MQVKKVELCVLENDAEDLGITFVPLCGEWEFVPSFSMMHLCYSADLVAICIRPVTLPVFSMNNESFMVFEKGILWQPRTR